MFTIKQVTDPRMNARICGSFGLEENTAFAYTAWEDRQILATAVFIKEQDGVCFYGADTGRRVDVPLIDGMIRAAFSAQMRSGIKTGRIGQKIDGNLRLSLTKLGYPAGEETFELKPFFARKSCAR